MRLQLIPGIHQATHRIALHLEATRPALGLTQGECLVVAYLHEAGQSAVGALHAAFGHKRSTLTSYLDRLERAGLVTRELRREDRRSFLVSLTAAGKAAGARVHRRLTHLEEAALAHLSERDVRGFHAVLEALRETAAHASRPAAAVAHMAAAAAGKKRRRTR